MRVAVAQQSLHNSVCNLEGCAARRLRRFERLASTKTLDGFYAARVLWGWAPRFGARTSRKQKRSTRSGRVEASASATPEVAKPRNVRVRRTRPSGLPNGRMRESTSRCGQVRRCAVRRCAAGRVAPNIMCSPRMPDRARSTEGSRLLDFGSRLGRGGTRSACRRQFSGCAVICEDTVATGMREQLWLRDCMCRRGSS